MAQGPSSNAARVEPPSPRAAFARNLDMLRRHRVEGLGVTEIAQLYSVSRQTVYNVTRAYDEAGIAGLVPGKSGPRAAFKCTKEVVDFLVAARRRDSSLSFRELAQLVSVELRVDLHPNTIRYALAKREGR